MEPHKIVCVVPAKQSRQALILDAHRLIDEVERILKHIVKEVKANESKIE